jgi:LPXTG-site transpeptidase (sortase) family protein
MRQAKPDIKLGRPIPAPSLFHPTQAWISGSFVFRYDAKRQICKRSPIDDRSRVGSMFFTVAKPAKQPRRRLRFPTGLKVSLVSIAAIAVMIAVYPWFPELQYRVRQSAPVASVQPLAKVVPEQSIAGNRVLIPKIGVDTPIVEGSDLKILDKAEGVWHQTGSLTNGNFVLAGHRFRYLPPNSSTLYNLGKLAKGDTIAVDWMGKRTVYQVTELKSVSEKEVSILTQTSKSQLTIYTCADMRQTQRTVVIAEPLPTP